MDYHVVEAKHVADYRIWVRFRDGRTGVVDLEGELVGPVFEPVREPEMFKTSWPHMRSVRANVRGLTRRRPDRSPCHIIPAA